MLALKYLALAHDWGAYFLTHYEEYLTSEFFEYFIWSNFGENIWGVFWQFAWWGLVIMYFVFWPITFPLTLVFGGGIIILLLILGW